MDREASGFGTGRHELSGKAAEPLLLASHPKLYSPLGHVLSSESATRCELLLESPRVLENSQHSQGDR